MLVHTLVMAARSSNVCDVRAAPWNARGDNTTDDTLAIQMAIDACHAAHPLGAIVRLSGPHTMYKLSASIALTSNLTLQVDANAGLFSSVTPASFNRTNRTQNARCPVSYWADGPTAVLCGTNLTNVAIVGQHINTSVLDGGGWPWYGTPYGPQTSLHGPRLFEVAWSKNVTLSHVTFQFSGGWTIHPQFTDGVLAEHIRILNPRWQGNTDGFDPDSCTNVVLRDSIIDTGDDGISIKSGNSSVPGSEHVQMPTDGVHIYRTKILSRNFCLGSATYGGIFNVLMEDCEIGDDRGSSPWAFKYKSHQGYAGALINHTYRRIQVGKIAPNAYQQVRSSFLLFALFFVAHIFTLYSFVSPQPHAGYFISIELRYHPLIPNRTCSVNYAARSGDCPIFSNVTFEDISIAGAARAGDINGFKGDLLRGLTFRNVTFATPPAVGWSCGYVDVATFAASGMAALPLKCSAGPAESSVRVVKPTP